MPGAFILSTLNGNNGFTVSGANAGDLSGKSVSSAGDINGDGIDDIIVGASGVDVGGREGAGQSYVLFGSTDGFPENINLSSLDGSNGFVLNGIDAGDASGISVGAAGDVNGDGIDDIIVGANAPNTNNPGEAYVIFGSDSGFPASIELSSLDGSNGFTILGSNSGDQAGIAVSSAGDINGDGIDDVIIGASTADPNGDKSGKSYVIFGRADGFDASIELSSLDGSNGFALSGVSEGDYSGGSVSAAGDINGDGFDDIIIGARFANPGPGGEYGGPSYLGEAYVVFGSDSSFPAQINLADLNGSDGFVIMHPTAYDGLGSSVSGAGDINGDGFDDIIIGAAGIATSKYGPLTSATYVVFGSAEGFSASLDLTSLDGSNGFVVPSSSDAFGSSVSAAGDVNGDGLDDIIIGASGSRFVNTETSYVIFGSTDGFPSSITLYTLDPADGFVIDGLRSADYAGSSVSAAGDVNGDGFDDLIIGALGASVNGESFVGQSYVVFGGPTIGKSIVEDGTSGDDSISGGEFEDILSGFLGDDTLTGGLGADTLLGGDNDDQIDGGADDDFLRGDKGNDLILAGAGNDTSYAGRNDTGNDSLDGGTGNDLLGGNAGNDQIDGGDGDDLLFGAADADQVNGDAGNDTVFGGEGDDTLDGGAGDDSLFGGEGDDLISGGSDADIFFFANGHGEDVVTDFDASEDTLFLANTVTTFTDVASVEAAATETTVDGTAGLLIDTGGGNSVFLEGITTSDLSVSNLVL